MIKKSKIYVLDTSAVLSGKPINIIDAKLVTTPLVSSEIKPGGRDYQNFQFMKEQGLEIIVPSKDSNKKILDVSKETGDFPRLSETDIQIMALALDLSDANDVVILTDDYSIQNVASELNIKFEPISQSGITKKFKWIYQCRGCGKKFKENISICPICGAKTRGTIYNKESLKRRK